MKKTIVAVMVAASAVLSAQAMATNTAQVTVLGEVSDAANSCVVTPTGTLNNGIVQLITVTTTEANAEAAGKLFKTQDFGFDVKDCARGSTSPVTAVTVNVSGTSAAMQPFWTTPPLTVQPVSASVSSASAMHIA